VVGPRLQQDADRPIRDKYRPQPRNRWAG
jgi:hypothetical protein